MSQDTPRCHHFRWRWFWAVFALMLAVYMGLCLWAHYQAQRWDARSRSMALAVQSVWNADSPTVIARIGPPTSSTQNGPELVLKYGPPDYPLGLEYRFVNGRPLIRDRTALAVWHMHPVARLLGRFNEIVLVIGIPLWLALGIGACFYHKYTRLVSHLLLATALFALAIGVSLEPLSLTPWFFGTIAVAVGILAIRSTYRTPKDDATPVCDECGYNLTGNVSGICPECGTLVPKEIRKTLAGDVRPA